MSDVEKQTAPAAPPETQDTEIAPADPGLEKVSGGTGTFPGFGGGSSGGGGGGGSW